MAGLNIVIPRAGGTGPIDDPLHSAGVSGYSHRYVASRLDQPVDSEIISFTDVGSAAVPLVPTGSGTAKVKQDGVVRYAELVASANTTTNYVLQGATSTYSPQVTIAVVARIPDPQVRIFESDAFALLRATSGQFQVTRTNGSAGSLLAAGEGGWAFLLAEVDSAALTFLLRRDSAEVTGPLTSASTGATPPRMGGNQGAPSKASHVAEALTWPRLLDATERQAVENAMKARYASILG